MTKIFDPIKIKDKLILPNRLVMSPMCQYSANQGELNNWHFIHYVTRAVGGVGTIIQEATAISPEGRISYADLGIWNKKQSKLYKKLTKNIKKYGCVPGIQLAHAGRKASRDLPWLGNGQIYKNNVNGWQIVSPSEIPYLEGEMIPHQLDLEEIGEILTAFKKAAKRAVKSGYEIIEIHAAHGYLIHQFLSPLINNRKDQYGGDFNNRIRILIEIINEVKKVLKGQSLWVRISATDWKEGGWDLAQSIKLVEELKKSGVDVVDVSTGGAVNDQQIEVKKEYQLPFASKIKEQVSDILVGTVGLIDNPKEIEQIIDQDKADLVLLGRELLRNPYFPIQVKNHFGLDLDWVKQYERASFRKK